MSPLTSNHHVTGQGYQTGFTCDGKPGGLSCANYQYGAYQRTFISLQAFYHSSDRRGWTLTRDGLAYCPKCTPKYNAPEVPAAVEPPAPEIPEDDEDQAPAPKPVPELVAAAPKPLPGSSGSLGRAPYIAVHYKTSDTARTKTWFVARQFFNLAADGIRISTYSRRKGRVVTVVIPYHEVLSLGGAA